MGEQETIAAPVAGRFSVKATRGPVQAGEELLSILPNDEELLLEVKVLNRYWVYSGRKPRSKWRLSRFKNLHY